MLAENLPAAAALMEQAREEHLVLLIFPKEHWRKVWSTNPLERLKKENKRRTRDEVIFTHYAAISCRVGALMLEHQEEWQLDGRSML